VSGLLARFFERRFHVSQTPPGWVEKLAGWATATGLNVTPDRALELTDVYACVRVLAESVAMLPLVLYRRLGDDGKERAPAHYLYSLLHDAPNPEMTSFTFRETLMGHLGTWGNAYAEIEFNRAGGINALWPLRPDRMKVERDGGPGSAPPRDLVYKYRLPQKVGGREITLPAERVFHLKGLAFDGRVGYSPIGLQRQAVGLGLAAEEYASRFYANDARPGGVLKHPGKLSDEAHKRLSKSWKEQHEGLSKAHRLAILEEGMEFQEIGLPPEDAQFIATSRLSTVKVARMYRVPLHLIQEQEKQTSWGTGIEQMNIGFVVYTLMPWLVRWEQEIGLRLLTPREREEVFAEHLVDGLLRGEVEKRYQAYATGRQWGWLSANDVRRLENMNPVDGGDTYLVPLNMMEAGRSTTSEEWSGRQTRPTSADLQVDLAVPGSDGETGRGAGRRGSRPGLSPISSPSRRGETQGQAQVRHRLMMRHLRLYEDVAARVLRRERNDVGNAAQRYLARGDRAGFSVWLRRFYQDHLPFVREQFAPLAQSYGELVMDTVVEEVGRSAIGLAVSADVAETAGEGGDSSTSRSMAVRAELEPRLQGFVEAYLGSFAARHATVSEGRIREEVEEAMEAGEDPAEALEAAMADWPEERAQETARWEAVRFANAVAVMAMTIAGVRRKVWVTFGDNCPYCNEMSGRQVGIDQVFLPIGMDFEPEGAGRPIHIGRSTGHPPLHDGCDCGISAA
jgi:HK97 family phage portal protein